MGLFDTIKENTNLVRGESSQSAGKFDQQIEAVEGQIREALIQIGTVYLEKHREDCEPEYGEFINQIKALEEQKEGDAGAQQAGGSGTAHVRALPADYYAGQRILQ